MPGSPALKFARTPDGFDLGYTVSGQGFPFVKMPGAWGGVTNRRLETYSLAAEALERRFRLIEYDSRGQGVSSRGIASWTQDDALADLRTVLSATGVDRFILFAPGFTVPNAIRFAAEEPGRVAALVIVEPLLLGEQPFELAAQRESLVLHNYPLTLRFLFLQNGDHESIAEIERGSLPVDQSDMLTMVRGQESHHWEPYVAGIEAPILLLQTRAPFPTDDFRVRAAACVPQARKIRLPGEKLALLGENLDPAMIEIDAFLTDCLPEATPRVMPAVSPALLTLREREVLQALVAGSSNAQVATAFVLSEATVARHVANIYAKLGVHNRAQAVARAAEMHL